jgi:P-type Ca2+ transporter type 2C
VHVPVIALALVPALLDWPVLLLPVHIVLLELLIDPACSVVFEAEPEADDVMSRPPRPAGRSPFSRANAAGGLLQGLGLAALLLAAHAALRHWGFDAAAARTTVFVALVLDVLLLTLANRRRPLALRRRATDSPWVTRMTIAIGVLLAVVLAFAPLRTLLGLAPPGAVTLVAATVMTALAAAWLGLLRRLSPA